MVHGKMIKLKIPETVWQKAYYGFVLFFIFSGFLLFIYSHSDRKSYPLRLFNVKSSSMEPKISKGSLLITYRLNDYKVGSVITFKRLVKISDGQINTVTHRIVAKEFNGAGAIYATKGDANEVQDVGVVRHDDIVGRVYFSFPVVGSLLDVARTTIGRLIFIFVPAGLIVLKEVRNIVQILKKG